MQALSNKQWHLPNVLSPSCLQTTVASSTSHWLWHTVPHTPLLQYSTRPPIYILDLLLPESLTDPLVQTSAIISVVIHENYHNSQCCLSMVYKHYALNILQRTLASREWSQLLLPVILKGQSVSASSVPVQSMLFSHTLPVPAGNDAFLMTSAPTS